ncbi:MAG: hypothetical protein HY719_14150 [Planctomycetes bacterium]|nr:hypothetical protein [Planctomycetota bacterium]
MTRRAFQPPRAVFALAGAVVALVAPGRAWGEESAAGGGVPPAPPTVAEARSAAEEVRYVPAEFAAKVEPPGGESGKAAARPERVSFPSPVTSPHESNNRAYFLHYAPEKESKTLIFVLPFHGSQNTLVEGLFARRFVRAGWHAAIMPLAYQYDRAPAETASGALFLTDDLAQTRANWRQSLLDVQRAKWWLAKERGIEHFGVFGISLGASAGAALFAIDPAFEAGAFLVPAGEVEELIWNSPYGKKIKATLLQREYTWERLQRECRPLNPSTVAPLARARAARMFMIAAKDDEVVPRATSERLHAALGAPRLLWLPGTHAGSLALVGRYLPALVDHFEKAFAAGPPKAAPGVEGGEEF